GFATNTSFRQTNDEVEPDRFRRDGTPDPRHCGWFGAPVELEDLDRLARAMVNEIESMDRALSRPEVQTVCAELVPLGKIYRARTRIVRLRVGPRSGRVGGKQDGRRPVANADQTNRSLAGEPEASTHSPPGTRRRS